MIAVLDAAGYLKHQLEQEYGLAMDEMKLHKLLYFAQRQALAETGSPLFGERLEGWVHGPVAPDVRRNLNLVAESGSINDGLSRHILDETLAQFGKMSALELRQLSHQEISWQNSRLGLQPEENGNRVLAVEDIRKDAAHARIFDPVWGMYLDEFEDA